MLGRLYVPSGRLCRGGMLAGNGNSAPISAGPLPFASSSRSSSEDGRGWGAGSTGWPCVSVEKSRRVKSRNRPKNATKMMTLIGSKTSPANLCPFDRNGVQHNVLIWLVLSASGSIGNLVRDLLSFNHFAKDGVIAGKPRCGRHSDEELRSIGIRACIGHGQLSRLVKFVW